LPPVRPGTPRRDGHHPWTDHRLVADVLLPVRLSACWPAGL